MTLTIRKAVRVGRPVPVGVSVWLLIVLGVSAVAGGTALVFGRLEEGMVPPTEWLDALPLIDSWLIPGLVLGIGFGLGSLLSAYGVVRRPHWNWASFIEGPTRHHWSWIATLLIGLGQATWIALEVAFLPEMSWLMAFYGPLGVALFLLPFTKSMREHLRVQ
ncbi:MAG TPA: hypothetical protein VJA46_14605 [Acidimicrobiia bacterium]|nr:hypothetical protein [Acidimicrobiia bacterium]